MRKLNRSGFNPRTGKNRAGFTRESCVNGGSACRWYETEEEARQRTLIDARGLVLAEGMSYRSEYPDGKPWQKRRAVGGRVGQVEVLFDGQIVLRTGESKLRGPWKFLSKRTKSLAESSAYRATLLLQNGTRSNNMSIMEKKTDTCYSDFVMPFGKHAGKTLDDIAETDVSYVLWLADSGVLKIEKEFLDACREDNYHRELDGLNEWHFKYS